MKRVIRMVVLGSGLAVAGFLASMLYAGWTSYRDLPEATALS